MKGKTILTAICVLLILTLLATADQIGSFYTQSNPFNISVDGQSNETYYLTIPTFSYITNATISLQTHHTVSSNDIYGSIPDDYRQDLRLWYKLNGNLNSSGINKTSMNSSGTGLTYNYINHTEGRAAVTTGKESWGRLPLMEMHYSTNFTLSFWIRLYNSSQVTPLSVFALSLGSAAQIDIYKTNTTHGYLRVGNIGGGNIQPMVSPTVNIVDRWNHFAISHPYNVSEYYLYMNGTLYDSSLAGNWNRQISANFMGREGGADPTPYAEFYLDDLRFYNRTLTESQIVSVSKQSTSKFQIFSGEVQSYLTNQTNFLNVSGEVDLNVSHLNSLLLDNCTCLLCSEIDTYSCNIPISFYSESPGLLQVNLSNMTIYTNLTIRVYDRVTDTLITSPTSLYISGWGNTTTSTGIQNIPHFPTTTNIWTLLAESTGYVTDQKQFVLTDRDSTSVDIFLINDTPDTVGNLIVQVFDEFYNYIVGANVKLLEYNTELDSFVEVSQCFSDSNGECIFDVELNTKYYIAQATYTDNGVVSSAQSTSDGQLIKIDNTIIELHLRTTQGYELPDTYDLVITPQNTSLVGNTSYLTAIFDDPSNTQHTVCIAYYTLNGFNEVEQSTTCVTASAGIVNYAGGYLLDRSFSWIAKIYVLEDNGQVTVYNSYRYDALEDTLSSSFSFLLRPILFAILLAMLALSLYLKNMKIFAFGTMGFAPLSLYWLPNWIGGITMSFIIILCICILYLTGKRQDLG